MRSTIGLAGIYLLVLLLAATFPIGAGDPAHGGALLHPTFGHVHLDNERLAGAPGGNLAASRNAQALAARAASKNQPKPDAGFSLGPALDATAGGTSEVPTTGLTPALPRPGLWLPISRAMRLISPERPWPSAHAHPPPDPPPTSLIWS